MVDTSISIFKTITHIDLNSFTSSQTPEIFINKFSEQRSLKSSIEGEFEDDEISSINNDYIS